MKLYAFDVDHTLAVQNGPYSPGPVTTDMLARLREEGHTVGVCGNWAVLTNFIPFWQQYVSFIGPFDGKKSSMLRSLKRYIDADEYIMVGNDPREWTVGVSDDITAAREAGFRFIREQSFAKGER